MSADAVFNSLYEQNLPLRLYAEHRHGLTVEELALLCSKPSYWVEERIEAARLCLEKQVRFVVKEEAGPRCSESVWAAQVWD